MVGWDDGVDILRVNRSSKQIQDPRPAQLPLILQPIDQIKQDDTPVKLPITLAHQLCDEKQMMKMFPVISVVMEKAFNYARTLFF